MRERQHFLLSLSLSLTSLVALSATMVYRYALRTDKEFDAVKAFIVEAGMSGFSVREEAGDNVHWHWYLETDLKPQAFRSKLTRKVVGLKGNGAYSLKECDEAYERYWAYMCKGASNGQAPVVSWRHGLVFDDRKVEELHASYWAENVSRKRARASVVEEVFQNCKRAAVQWDDEREIAREYIKVLVDRNRAINLFAVKSNVNLLRCKLAPSPEDGIQILLNQW